MSFSNTDTDSKPADPYKEKNIDNVSIQEKVTDLSDFVSACKFGMMTTWEGASGQLVSRCMALAAKARSEAYRCQLDSHLISAFCIHFLTLYAGN